MSKKRVSTKAPTSRPGRAPRWLWGIALSLGLLALTLLGPRFPFLDEADSAAAQRPESRVEMRAPERLRVRVVASYPHDPSAYTQGLLWHDGALFESTGTYGRSAVQRYDLATGKPTHRRELAPDFFGEGLARVDDTLVQLTWKRGLALRYRTKDLEEAGSVAFSGEGWGLCFDGQHLIMSDGTHVLTLRDRESLEPEGRLTVRRRGQPLDNLNELECFGDSIYANVYQTDQIVEIDPRTGQVRATIDASGLLTPEEAQSAEVLNGIAYREETKTFLLTGKYWPRVFEVVFEPIT